MRTSDSHYFPQSFPISPLMAQSLFIGSHGSNKYSSCKHTSSSLIYCIYFLIWDVGSDSGQFKYLLLIQPPGVITLPLWHALTCFPAQTDGWQDGVGLKQEVVSQTVAVTAIPAELPTFCRIWCVGEGFTVACVTEEAVGDVYHRGLQFEASEKSFQRESMR